jgi:cephalosporin hydroxylase
VGASSVRHDPSRAQYDEWAELPWVGEAGFPEALGRVIATLSIETVFTSHPVVSARMRSVLPSVAPGVDLASADPWAADLADYRLYREIAAQWRIDPLLIAAQGQPAPRLTELQMAGLIRSFYTVPGECDHQKLEALAEIFRYLPAGDLVEIGSLWGRSATALAYLARQFGIGKVLCVDPWRMEALPQGIEDVDTSFGKIPIEQVFEAFRVNIAPFAGDLNYVRACSIDGAGRYAARRIETRDFGATEYTGEIALLHIDANHSLEAARADIEAWTDWLRPGGWLVVDDYRWSFGDGPRIAADEFCGRMTGKIDSAFVAGGALFVQLAG